MRFHLCSFWIKYNPACTKIIYLAFTEFLVSFFFFFFTISNSINLFPQQLLKPYVIYPLTYVSSTVTIRDCHYNDEKYRLLSLSVGKTCSVASVAS